MKQKLWWENTSLSVSDTCILHALSLGIINYLEVVQAQFQFVYTNENLPVSLISQMSDEVGLGLNITDIEYYLHALLAILMIILCMLQPQDI